MTTLPKPEHEAAEWQAAMEALILVVTLGGPTMFARIGIMRALNRHVERGVRSVALQLLTLIVTAEFPDAVEKIAGGASGVVAGRAILHLERVKRWFQN